MIRTVSVFFKALLMTLRGEQALSRAQRDYPQLYQWITTGQALAEQLQGHIGTAPIPVKLDGRSTTAQKLIAGVVHHLSNEYPYLLNNPADHMLTAIYATNLNDQYAIQQLELVPGLPPSTQASISQLLQHLLNVPPSQGT